MPPEPAIPFSADHFRARDWWRDETLAMWLDRCANQRGDKAAVVTPARTMSYGDLKASVSAFASGLHHAGIGPGDIVAVHLPNIAEFLIAWFAINERGAVMQTIHLPYGRREVEHMLAHSGAKAALALSDLKGRSPSAEIVGLKGKVASLKTVVTVGAPAAGTENFSDLMALGTRQPVARHAGNATDPFLQLYTSGTTSAPKAVAVSFNHFLSNARMCAAELGITGDDRLLCLAPYTHLYGLFSLELGFSVAAAACMVPVFTPADFVETLKRTKPTILIAGPAHIGPCLQNRMFDGVDLSSIRFAVLSGTTVPRTLSERFEAMLPNSKVVQAWGMTELQFGACSRISDSPDVRFETIGRATPGTELRVAGADGLPLSPGIVGELQIRGCSLFSGYVANPGANESCFTPDGWFNTGDLASMDAEGNVSLNGRSKELINRGGVKFNPIDLENAIAAHPSVVQVAIAPVPDPILGERAACFVILHPGAAFDMQQLKTFLQTQGIAKFIWPEQLEIVEEMPMTPTRKIMKAELVRRFLADAAHPPA